MISSSGSIASKSAVSNMGSVLSSASPKAGGGANSVEKDFLAYAKMSPIDRMRASVMKSMNVTDDDLRSMSSDQRQKVEDQIAKQVREAMDRKFTGRNVDVHA